MNRNIAITLDFMLNYNLCLRKTHSFNWPVPCFQEPCTQTIRFCLAAGPHQGCGELKALLTWRKMMLSSDKYSASSSVDASSKDTEGGP